MVQKQKKTVELKIAAVNQSLFEGNVDFVIVPGLDGDVGIMAEHVPFLAPLRKGRIDIVTGENPKQSLQVEGGVVAVADNTVRILVNNISE